MQDVSSQLSTIISESHNLDDATLNEMMKVVSALTLAIDIDIDIILPFVPFVKLAIEGLKNLISRHLVTVVTLDRVSRDPRGGYAVYRLPSAQEGTAVRFQKYSPASEIVTAGDWFFWACSDGKRVSRRVQIRIAKKAKVELFVLGDSQGECLPTNS